MKRMLQAAIAAAAAGSALAQPAPVPDWLRAMGRSDYGCEVLLCLANPGGPWALPQCAPSMSRLARDLAAGRGFPTCSMAGGPGGRSYALPAARPYDACPPGTSALPAGQYAELAASSVAPAPPARSGAASPYGAGFAGLTYAGIGDGSGYGYSGADGPAPAKVCVAGYRGSRLYAGGDSSYAVALYDTIYVQRASPGMAVDVYIDDRLWQTVRW